MNITDEDYLQAYQYGVYYLDKRDFTMAKAYFDIAKEALEYRKKSLNALALIEIYNTNYQEARDLLNQYKEELYHECASTYAFLERIEFNLQEGFGIILDSFNEPQYSSKKLMYLADYYLEMGDYEKARLTLETINLNFNFRKEASLKLISLNIIEGSYTEALKIFKSIENLLTLEEYNQIKAIIYYHIGTIHDIKDLKKNIYFVNRLLTSNEDNLIRHLEVRHLKRINNETESLFFKNTDLVQLIKDVKLKIKDLNPTFDKNAFIYQLQFPNLIGYSNGKPTNSIKVVTALGTNKIITIYPSILSSKYNQEGLRESKEFRLKRDIKWKN